jgi:hypothetical protein
MHNIRHSYSFSDLSNLAWSGISQDRYTFSHIAYTSVMYKSTRAGWNIGRTDYRSNLLLA